MDSLPALIIDISAALIIFLSVLFGFFRGFTREILAITAWIAAGIITEMSFDWTSSWVETNITTNIYLIAAISVLVVFLILLIIFMILGGPLWRGVRRSGFWLIDSALGLFFGLARGVLVLCIVVVGLAHAVTHETRGEWAQTSKVLPYADDATRQLLRIIKEMPHDRVQEGWFQDMMTDLESRMGPRPISTGLPPLNNSATEGNLSVEIPSLSRDQSNNDAFNNI